MPQTIQLPSGATEADINRALSQPTDGGTIVLPQNETISISSGLIADVADRDITLDLNGSTLQQAANVTVVTGRGQHTPLTPVSLGQDAAGNTTITYASPQNDLTIGSWIKVVSDDFLPGDSLEKPTRLGQAMEVLAIDGNTVTFDGALLNQALYATNVRATAYLSGDLVIENGEIVGNQSQGWSSPLVQARMTVDPHIEDLTVRDGSSYGISIVDSVNAQITDPIVKNLQDAANLGIAVQSLSSTGTTVDGLYAENVTHAADDNAITAPQNSADARYYGGDIGMNVHDSVAYGARNFAWSWHSEANNGLFENVKAFDSYGFLDARGIGGTVTDSAGANNQRGIILFEFGNGDARDITIDDVTLKETLHYSTIAINEPGNNRITESFFEAYGSSVPVDPRFATTTNTTYVRGDADENDTLVGSADADQLLGGKGNDTLSGTGGDDFLWGGAGVDVLTGGEGRDRFGFNSPSDAVDLITDFTAAATGDIIDLSVLGAKLGWPRDDLIGQGYVRFVQSGADAELQIDTDGGADSFSTLAILQNTNAAWLGTANVLSRLSSQDASSLLPQVVGTDGNDTLAGGDGSEVLLGLAGDDTLDGGPGDDQLEGGPGNDTYILDAGDRVIEAANAGSDTVVTSAQLDGTLAANVEALTLGGDTAVAGAGNDLDNVLTGNGAANNLTALAGHDTLSGGNGADRMLGEEGGDVLEGGAGADTLSGGIGYDTASYASAAAGVAADLITPSGNSGDAAGDFFSSIENLTGSAFSDVLGGNDAINVLEGGAGADQLSGAGRFDTLRGGLGDDWLNGGAAADMLEGGAGHDLFLLANDLTTGDMIADFVAGGSEDAVVLSGFGPELDSFAELASHLTQAGADVTLQLDANDSATIRNVAVGSLTQDDFLFV